MLFELQRSRASTQRWSELICLSWKRVEARTAAAPDDRDIIRLRLKPHDNELHRSLVIRLNRSRPK